MKGARSDRGPHEPRKTQEHKEDSTTLTHGATRTFTTNPEEAEALAGVPAQIAGHIDIGRELSFQLWRLLEAGHEDIAIDAVNAAGRLYRQSGQSGRPIRFLSHEDIAMELDQIRLFAVDGFLELTAEAFGAVVDQLRARVLGVGD